MGGGVWEAGNTGRKEGFGKTQRTDTHPGSFSKDCLEPLSQNRQKTTAHKVANLTEF